MKDISQSLTEDIITLQSFKEQLLKDNANYTSTINSIYVFYGIMKRFFVLLISLLLWSCDTGWVMNPPYQSEWVIVNQTGCDVRLCIEKVYANDNSQEYEEIENYSISDDDIFCQQYQGDNENRGDFLALFFINSNSHELISSKVYLTTIDGEDTLKVWVMGEDNGEHDLFDETQWVHEYQEDSKTERHTIYHNKWTFTITDADLVGVEE